MSHLNTILCSSRLSSHAGPIDFWLSGYTARVAKALFYDVDKPLDWARIRTVLEGHHDAIALGRQAQVSEQRLDGLLLSGLDDRQADEFHEQWASLGVKVAAENWLHLPPPTYVRRLRSVDSEQLVFGNSVGASLELRFSDIVLLCAARLNSSERVKETAEPGADALQAELVRTGPAGVAKSGAAQSDRDENWVLDVFAREPSRRIRIVADGINYGGLPGTLAPRAIENFRTLAELVFGRAGCAHNRGLAAFVGGECPRIYDDELVLNRESSALLFQSHLGDLTRFPLPEQPATVPPLDLVAMLGGHSPMPAPRVRKRLRWGKRKLLTAVQLIVIAVLLSWFLRVAGQLIRGDAFQSESRTQLRLDWAPS